MASLERRGLAAKVVNHQPGTWVRVLWAPGGQGAPLLLPEAIRRCSTRLVLKLAVGGPGWTLRTKGDLFTVEAERKV